ncbi:helicase-exonuclease AddAB subunit AddA [Anaerotignum sp.]
MANRWTEEQRKAIEARGSDLLVSAAAGSGKTAVLVERIIQKIIEEGQEIDRLLVVTFTNAAATEMRQRVGAAIAKKLEEDPDNIHLQSQMAFLPRADIKTIHAFCLQIIKEYYHLLEIDPAVRTADPAEVKLLQKEVLEELFEELYAEENNEWFLNLLETFTTSTKDDKLKDLVLQAYEYAEGSPEPEGLLEEAAENFAMQEGQTIDDCKWFSFIREGVQNQVEYALYQLQKAFTFSDGGEFEGYHNLLGKEVAMLENLRDALDKPYPEWRLAYIAVDFARLPAYKGQEKEWAERIKELRNDAKDTVRKIGEVYFAYSAEMQADLIRNMYPIAKALSDVTKRFIDAFAAAKKEKNIIDFSDYEHFALKILLDENGRPTQAAEEIRQKYDEIMIDEYQDSNIVQELVLQSVSGEVIGENNRFMVGDVKQSIYRFRQAMPELFNEKYMRYPAEEGGKERKIVLSKNFRSRKNILDGINFIFRQIMCRELGDIEYDAEAALYAGMEFPPCAEPHGGANEIILIETKEGEESDLSEELQEMDRRQVEATAIAKRIKELLESGYHVLDKKTGEYRPVQYGDIAILLRTMKNWSSVLEDVFGREGLPFYAETAEGYYSVPEVETVLNLLRLIDNPRQDIPLLSILHSPIYGLTADELMQVRLSGGKGSYYDCLQNYLEDGENEELRGKISAFLGDIDTFRRKNRDLSLHELLRMLYRETGYYDYLGMTSGGALRQANLRLLLDKAEQYEQGSRKGLFYFIRYVEDMKTAEVETSSAKLQDDSSEHIRVMTIHKSKGLEFPVVFVSDMGKAFNEMDSREKVIFHQKWGMGMDWMDLDKRVSYRTLSRMALADAIRMENLAEEIRVLYVALTRAKEKLILTGTTKDLEKSLWKWSQTAETKQQTLPLFRLRRAKSYFDWVMPAYMRHPGFEQNADAWAEMDYRFGKEDSQWSFSILTRDTVLQPVDEEQKLAEEQQEYFAGWESPAEMTAQREEIFRILSWQYPYGKETKLPAKLSISEIKRKYQEEMSGELQTVPKIIRLPEKQEAKGLTGAQIGTAMHTVLEECDLRKEYDKEGLEELISGLVKKGRLTEEEAKAVRGRELLQFFKSRLAQRLRVADKIETERTFSLLMQPKELFFGKEYETVTDTILVNGIIDCYFVEKNQVILLDYKSDRIYDEEELKERYRIQLQLYKLALERALSLPVAETYIYSLAMGKEISLE